MKTRQGIEHAYTKCKAANISARH